MPYRGYSAFHGMNPNEKKKPFRDFLFYQNIICFGCVINLFQFCVMFFIKKESFPAKAAV